MKVKRIISFVLLVVFAAMFLMSGCGSAGGDKTESKTTDSDTAKSDNEITLSIITFGSYTPGGPPHANTGETSVVVTEVYPEFEKRMPHVKLEFETLQGDTEGYSNYLLRGASGTLADISMLDGYWIAAFASQGYTVPMEKVLPKEALDNYFDAYKCVYKGEIHGLVHSTAFNGVLWYRESLFKEAGLDGPPKTWDEMREYARKLTVPGERYGLVMPLAKSEHTSVCLLGYYWSGEDVFIDSNNRPQFVNDTSIRLFNLIKGMYDDKSIPEEALTMTYDDAERLFDNGMAAMLQHGSWLCTGWEVRAPEIADDIAVAPLPAHPVTGQSSQNAGGWAYAVTTKDTSKYEAAAEWLKIMLIEDETTKKRIAEAGEIPVTKSLADKIDWLPEKYGDIIASMLPTSKTRPIVEIYPDGSLEYVQALQEVLTGGKDPETALKDAADRIEKLARESGWLE